MLRYETIKVTVPADGEAKKVILSIPKGKKATLKGIANNWALTSIIFIEIEGNRLIRVYYDMNAGYGNFVPLNMEVDGPQEIKAGAESIEGSSGDVYLTLMYEE